MKSLFDKYESYTKKGVNLSNEVQQVIDPIMEKWADKGYRAVDIETIITDHIGLRSTIIKAKRALKMRKEEHKNADDS